MSWASRKTQLAALVEKVEILCCNVQQERDAQIASGGLPRWVNEGLSISDTTTGGPTAISVNDALLLADQVSLKAEVYKAFEIQVEAKLTLARVEVDMT